MEPDSPQCPPESDRVAELRSQVRVVRSIWARRLYFAIGSTSFVLGMIGLLLPVIPTTPFLLVSAHFYALSSERFYVWLLTNRFFGEYIRDWREHRGIPLRTKVWAILLLWVTIIASMVIVAIPIVCVITGTAAFGVSVYIWRQPTKPAKPVARIANEPQPDPGTAN